MMKKTTFIFLFILFGSLIGGYTFAKTSNCPKITIDPQTKKVSIIACEEGNGKSEEKSEGNKEISENKTENIGEGSVSSPATEDSVVKTNVKDPVGEVVDSSLRSEGQTEKKVDVKSGAFTRISKKGECPQIFVNDTTKDIKIVKCGEQLGISENEKEITENSAENVGEGSEKPIKNPSTSLSTDKASSGGQENKEEEEKKATAPVSTKPEFEQALEWMYANGLTKFNTPATYRPHDPLLREEAAKMFGKAYEVLGYDVKAMKNQQCEFSDEGTFTLDLVRHITDVCHWGLFKGANGKFDAKTPLTKAQATAVLIRMLEGKGSYEQLNPWWTNYYQKAFLLGITKVDNINIYDKIQNRKEIALMLWRFKQIVESKNKNTWLKQIEKIDGASGSSLNLDNWEQDLNKVLGDINFKEDPELIEAIHWMHDQGLTNFQDIKKYAPSEVLTRGQAAKIFDIFSTALGRKVDDGLLPNACVFSDISQLSKESILHIQNVCKKGLIHGVNGKFDPDGEMLKSQFMVILVRLFDDKVVDSSTTPWWKGYFQRARELGLVEIADVNSFDKAIRRYEVALFLYRFNVRYNIVNNINTSTVNQQLITTIENTETTVNDKKQIDAYIDMSLFSLNDLELAYLYVFDTRYKVVKSLRREYIDDAFVWYGDVFDLVDNKKLGTMNLIIRNDRLISGVMRIEDTNYILQKKDGVEAYFTVIEQ